MDLFHAIILNHDNTQSHKVLAQHELELTQNIIAGPFAVPFMSTALVAIGNHELSGQFSGDVIDACFVMGIVDDLEKRPLITGCTQARAIFWLAELLDGIRIGFDALGFVLKAVEPDVSAGTLQIRFSILHTSERHVVGSLMCLFTMLDSLFFARGLLIENPRLTCTGNHDEFDYHLIENLQAIVRKFYAL